MNLLIKTILLTIFANSLLAQSFKLETVKDLQPANGIIYKKLIESNRPLSINLLEIDLKNPNLDIMATTAFDSVAGNETITSMAARTSKQKHKVVAAINADFYEKGGYSTNAFVSDGEFVSMPNKTFTAIGFDASNTPYINKIKFSANLIAKNMTLKINGINKSREENQLIIYNHFYGSHSATNHWGSEVDLRLLSNPAVNDTIFFIAKKLQKGKGNMPIKSGHYVLSGHDVGAETINRFINTGDTVKVIISLKNMPKKLNDLTGGFAQLVTKGNNSAVESYNKVGNNPDHFLFGRHPRTAIGYNKSKTKLYMVTVDGRQASSIGINLPDLADLMIQFGAYAVLNLDGGGSTSMLINNEIVNSPSDVSGARAVSNALLVRYLSANN